MIETVLCIDIGTTSLKAGLITAQGEVVSVFTKRFSDPQNRFIANKWLDSVKRIVRKIPKDYLSGVKAVAVSGNGPTVVSKSGMTLRWNEQVDLKSLGINGANLVPSLFLPRILSFKKLFQKEYENSNFIFSGPEFLIYELTGNAFTILPEQRFISAYWTSDLLNQLRIEESKLPGFISTGDSCGFLKSELALELGLKSDVSVIAGGPDFVVALIGTNTLQPGRICDRCGSSEGFNFCVPDFIIDSDVRSLPSVISDLWNISVLSVRSSKLSEKQRFEFAQNALSILKKISKKHKWDFPGEITVTGGQVANEKLMAEKAKTLGIRLVACQNPHAELLGDACAGWFGLGIYNSLQEAADNIVKEDKVYDCL